VGSSFDRVAPTEDQDTVERMNARRQGSSDNDSTVSIRAIFENERPHTDGHEVNFPGENYRLRRVDNQPLNRTL
jgi:hypothetical protein